MIQKLHQNDATFVVWVTNTSLQEEEIREIGSEFKLSVDVGLERMKAISPDRPKTEELHYLEVTGMNEWPNAFVRLVSNLITKVC